ncbi:MAG: rod shape-determining protein RodA [Chitinophagaceae bacterium]|nr:rod shape-determining protein RodA [Chitinophagaceae bacterium]
MAVQKPEISKGTDWFLLSIYFLLVGIGLTAIFAVTYKEGDPVLQSFFRFKTDYSKQLYFFLAACFIGLMILLTDSKFFTATANLGYLSGILAMLLVFPFHSKVKGTESIIRLGAFNFQPAEFCKLFVALALAKYLSRPETDFSKTRSQLIASFIVLLPAALSVLQKETGLALVYFSFFIVMYREGLPAYILITGFAVAALIVASILVPPNTLALILSGIALVYIYVNRRRLKKKRGLLFTVLFLWLLCVGIQRFLVPYLFKHVLQKHQVERIFELFGKDNPYADEKENMKTENLRKKKESGTSYNVRQSKIAIGSGRIFGKGILSATQTRYDFVPEQRTDFIFCTIGEGFGFIGSIILLGLYLLMLFRIITIAEKQRSVFSRCYAYGVASVLFFHIAINIGMTVGLAPVIGIPLPFVSYGGTSLLTFSIMLFILLRLDADRQMILR